MEIRKKILVYMNYQRIKLTTMFKTNLLLSVALCLVLGLLHTPLVSNEALAQESTDKVLINEIQLDGDSAYEEFIEIGSTSSSPISLNGWRIEITKLSNNLEETNICTGSARFTLTFPEFSQNKDNSGNQLPLTVDSHKPMLIAAQKDATRYFLDFNPDLYYSPCKGNSSVLSANLAIRLFNDKGDLQDEVYIMPSSFADSGSPKINPVYYDSTQHKGMSFQRDIDANGLPIDTDNCTNDFKVFTLSTPGEYIQPSSPDGNDDSTGGVADGGKGGSQSGEDSGQAEEEQEGDDEGEVGSERVVYPKIELSELMINPASPLLDSNDEWVEIYNPSDQAVDISGYRIYAGKNYTYRHIFPTGTIINPFQYMVVTSGESTLSLSNSGGAVKIVAPDGTLLDQTTYSEAKEGLSWAKDNTGNWQWTTTPTEAAANQITTLPVVLEAAKKKAAKKTTTPKAKTAKKSSAKKTAVKAKKAKTINVGEDPALIAAPAPIPTWILAILGFLAILYACYEYRFEIGNYLYKFKKYRKNR